MVYKAPQQIELSPLIRIIQKNNWIGNKNFSPQESDGIIQKLVGIINEVAFFNRVPPSVNLEHTEVIDKRISKATIRSLDNILNGTISYMPPKNKERDSIRLELQFNQPDEDYAEMYEDLEVTFDNYKPRSCKYI